MAHIFPPERLATGEHASPVRLNRALQPVAEKVAAGLNEQDLSATEAGGGKLIPTTSVAANAYYRVHQVKALTSMGLDSGAHRYAKQSATTPVNNTATILDTTDWQPVAEDVTGARLAKTIATGEDILFVLAQLQIAGWKGALTEFPSDASESAHRVQFALRLDGVPVEDTITGPVAVPDDPPRQVYGNVRAAASTNDYDFRHRFWQKDCSGLPNYLQPVRLTRAIPVVEGSHTADVVVRRMPPHNYELDNSGAGSCLQVFNRRLVVIQIKGWSKYGGGVPSLVVSAYQDGEVVSRQSLVSNRLAVVRDGLADVTEGAVQRGALRNEHLPSLVKFPSVRTLTPASGQAIAAFSTYAGYGSSTGWQQVTDGAGTALMVDAGGGGFTNLGTTNAGTLLVLVNVQVMRINVAGQRTGKIAACFCIRYKDNANVWNYLGETEAVLTPRNEADPEGESGARVNANPGQNPCEDDVPLLWAVDTVALVALNPNASTIKEIEVVAATHDATNSGYSVRLETQRATLTAFLLDGVTLG